MSAPKLTETEREQRCRKCQRSEEHYSREAVEGILAARLTEAERKWDEQALKRDAARQSAIRASKRAESAEREAAEEFARRRVAERRLAAVEELASEWERVAGPDSEAWRVFGPQRISVDYAVTDLRAAIRLDAGA